MLMVEEDSSPSMVTKVCGSFEETDHFVVGTDAYREKTIDIGFSGRLYYLAADEGQNGKRKLLLLALFAYSADDLRHMRIPEYGADPLGKK